MTLDRIQEMANTIYSTIRLAAVQYFSTRQLATGWHVQVSLPGC